MMPGMRSLRGFVVVAIVTAFAVGSSANVPASKSFFLAADPHVPLAVVDGGSIHGVGDHCTVTTRWGPVGSSWRALDAWGQVLTTRTVARSDRYDVTGCNELVFGGHPAASIYVSSGSPWSPSPSREWAASSADRATFLALARRRAPVPSPNAFCHGGAALPEARFFDVGTAHHAVYGGIGVVVVARRDPSGWVVVTTMTTPSIVCTRPVAIFDMNGDGVLEIVLRENEPGTWDELVFARTPSGTWATVATSPGGATI
jgi:hypothetical protein